MRYSRKSSLPVTLVLKFLTFRRSVARDFEEKWERYSSNERVISA